MIRLLYGLLLFVSALGESPWPFALLTVFMLELAIREAGE